MIHWRSGLLLSKEVVLQRQVQAHCSLHMSSHWICSLCTARNNHSEKQEHQLSEWTSRSHSADEKVPTFNGNWRFITVFPRALVLLCKKFLTSKITDYLVKEVLNYHLHNLITT